MAYARKYYCEFTDVQYNVHAIYILEKDYEGQITALRGETDQPFVTTYETDSDYIFTPIRAKECTLNFTAENGISLLNFYSEDDEQFRIDHYIHSVAGTVIDKLLASYFIVQDSCEQEFAAEPFVVTLKGTDNIALLKEVPFTTEGMPYHTDNGNFLGEISLFDYIKIAIQQTGLTDMPLRIYSNIFENTNEDRTDSDTTEGFQQVFMNTGGFLSNEGAWENLYTILTEIFTTFNCCFFQDNGAWNITRRQESYLFTDNRIAGVEHDLTTGDKTAIELDYNWPVVFDSSIVLDKADHISRIQRPFNFAKETFNYNQPESYIANSDLQLPPGAVPYETETIDNIRYDRYSIADYFPEWIQRGGINSYLEVATNTLITPERETGRYIVVEGVGAATGGIQFNPIPITAGDVVDFSASVKTLTNTADLTAFWVRADLITSTGDFYVLVRIEIIVEGIPYGDVRWFGPFPATEWDTTQEISTVLGTEPGYMYFRYEDSSGQWTEISTQLDIQPGVRKWPAPADGMLLIQMNGSNLEDTARHDMCFKDVNLQVTQYINDSTQITGQYHINEQDKTIKNFYDEEITIDDSPRNTIAGTLFTNDTTNFDYTDINTGAETLIDEVHFTRTRVWHRANIAEERRLGEIIVFERMHQAFKARTVIEGTLYGTRYQVGDDWNFVSLLCLLTLDSRPGLNFIFGMLEVDWMNANYKAVLNELYKSDPDNEPFNFDYTFNYIYRTV